MKVIIPRTEFFKTVDAFAVVRCFRRHAKSQGYTTAETVEVIDECLKGDYKHSVLTLSKNIELV